jgi:hypothetical protein
MQIKGRIKLQLKYFLGKISAGRLSQNQLRFCAQRSVIKKNLKSENDEKFSSYID